jgi:hypothetical protein
MSVTHVEITAFNTEQHYIYLLSCSIFFTIFNKAYQLQRLYSVIWEDDYV